MATKKKHYRVTVYNMNGGRDKNGKPQETEEVTVCAKTQGEAERLAVSGGLVCRENGWGAWDAVEVDEKGNEVNPKKANFKKAKSANKKKCYRITFRSEAFVWASSPEEAEEIYCGYNLYNNEAADDLDLAWVETNSVEEVQ